DFCQGCRFALPLFGRAERFARLIIVREGFREVVLHVVYFADPKQLVTLQCPGRRYRLKEPRLIKGPRAGGKNERHEQMKRGHGIPYRSRVSSVKSQERENLGAVGLTAWQRRWT